MPPINQSTETPQLTFEATVSYKASVSGTATGGHMVVFSIHIPEAIRQHITDQARIYLPCELKNTKGVHYSAMQAGAELRLTGRIITGARGGQRLKVSFCEILTPVKSQPLPKFLLKEYKAARLS